MMPNTIVTVISVYSFNWYAKLHVISIYMIFKVTNILSDNIIRIETGTFSAVILPRLCNNKNAEYVSNVSA